jgi:serine protease Do
MNQGLGSGVVIDAEGFILTNAHVIEGAAAIHVRTEDGDDIDAAVVGRDPDTDLALLKAADSSGLRPAPLGDSDRAQPGEWVVAIGSPFGLHHTVTTGILSAKARGDGSGLDFLQTDAAVNPGNSGGPLFDLNGNVIGIAVGILSERGQNIGLNFAIPINTVKEVLPQLRRGTVVHGSLGIDTRTLTRAAARLLGIDAPEALLVTAVDPEGPAARAGIEAGDALLGLAAPRTATARELRREVWRTSPGTPVRIRAWRRGVASEVPVVVGQSPGVKE